MKWLISVLGSRLGPWIILGVLLTWGASLGGLYLQGRHDGHIVCEAVKQKQELKSLHNTLQTLVTYSEENQEFWMKQESQNQKFAETLENKIHNKETIIKEKLREVPIEVAADCSIDYNAVRVHNIIAAPTGSN